ncbi:MAG: transcriptional regulator [Chloroflexi bacterium]|nr:transcriptional regulator [Chloroflexota bacterium]
MKAKVIKNEKEYQEALRAIEDLMDAASGSPDEERLDLLSLLVRAYEAEHHPIGLPDPIEAIKFRMHQEGLTQKDMQKYFGSQSKVSEVLNYKRPLSLSMIRALHAGLGIPAEVLVQEINLAESVRAPEAQKQ